MSDQMIAGTIQEQELLTISQAARILGVCEQTVRRLTEAKKLGVYKVPGVQRRRYRATDVRALAERSYTPASA